MFVGEEKAFCWNYFENGRAYSFKAILEEKEMFEAFREFIAKSVFESSSKTSFAKYKRSNQDYIINAFTNNINSFTNMDTGKERVEKAKDDGLLNIQKTDSAVCLTYGKCQSKHENGSQELFYNGTPKNYIMSACQSSGLSYLVRGNKIGVYAKDHGSCLEFSYSIDNIQTLTNSSPLYPTSAILHDQGSSCLMLDVDRQDNTVYKMDLSREGIVEEWKVNDENTLMAICPSSQTPYRPNNDQTIVGITSSSLFRIDPRQPRMNKLCESEYKKYSSRPEFSTVSSSRSKHVAVGSKKGVIRIFDELNTVASITLPPIGEPILGLDIMPNGHYVLATCSNFLMLVHTISHDQAMTLRIRPEHVTLMNENVSFKRAYFDTLNENNIICTTGSFVVFWNFKSVCQGNFDSYKMQRLEAPIVASANASKEGLVIAFEDQVCKIAK
ncbi:hypothetical protein G6F56_007010 [Rhizopus delemar]|nr:hypothetical protein G6F56_007010 [Rhizopus delemar]